MKRILLALFLTVSGAAYADVSNDAKLAFSLEPVGDTSSGEVAVRIAFRFVTPREVPAEAMLELQGSISAAGSVVKRFRMNVPASRDSVTTVQTVPAGEIEVDARILIPTEDPVPLVIGKAVQKATIERTGRPYIADAGDGAEGVVAEGAAVQVPGAVRIRPPRRDVAPNLFIVEVETKAPVQRVEFFVEGKKIAARNAAPYRAELDLGKLPKRVEVRAVGLDARGRYVDADAFVVNERETPLEVKISRTATDDGTTHLKLSIQNPKNTKIVTVAIFAGTTKLHEWQGPPYAVSVPTRRLEGADFLRAAVVDETGYEASDLVFLNGERYVEHIEVDVVELPVSVTDSGGAPVTTLERESFTVLENGKPQKISAFDFAANLPLSVGVLLDHSGSMAPRIKDAKAAAVEFFRRIIKPGDRAFFGAFAFDPADVAPFASNIGSLEAQVAATPEAVGGTALHDAVVTGLYRFRAVEGRRALIVITDGEDTSSRLAYDDMLMYARAARVPLYFVGVGLTFVNVSGTSRMKALAAETGGVAYFVRDVKQLAETYRQLEADLRSQYLLAYNSESAASDRAYRTIEVKVGHPDAKVRTIRGYIP